MDSRFEHHGWRWEEVTDILPWQIPDPYVMQAIYNLPKDSQPRIYDLGCGIGRHTVYFARYNCEVYASDISKEGLQKTQERLQKENLTAQLHQGHFLDVSFPDNYFDLVVSINTINHGYKAEVWKIVNKIYRMLKPGGHFIGTLRMKRKGTKFYSTDIKVLDDQTFVYLEGEERGIPHHFVTWEELPELFNKFETEQGSFIQTRIFRPPFTGEHFQTQMPSENLRIHVKKPL